MILKEIINGHINELKSLVGLTSKDEETIYSIREKICNHCPLKTGNTCDPRKWIHPDTLEVSDRFEKGFVSGCGCRLSAKQKSKTSSCPAGFWNAIQ